MRQFTKRSAALVAGAVLAVAGGTAAFAYANGWFQGTSTTYAEASTIKPVTIVADTRSATTRLYPAKGVTVSATVTNQNDYPIRVNSATITSVTSNKAGCGVDEADLSFSSIPAGSVTVAAGVSESEELGQIVMGADANAVCSGATFTVLATLAGEIAA